MSYLHLPSLNMGDTPKGTISLWFRFSKDSVDKAALYQSPKPYPGNPDVLDKTMPLVTFGRKVMAHVYGSKGVTFSQPVPGGNMQAFVTQVDPKPDAPCAPSHIGIDCSETPVLVLNFQMETRAEVQGLYGEVANITWSLDPGPGTYVMHRTLVDASYVRVAQPETFLVRPKFEVKVDKWHHLLLSFDFSSSVDVVAVVGPDSAFPSDDVLRSATIQSYCRIWYAFDDENKKGKDNIGNNFSNFAEGWVSGDENGIIPRNAEAAIQNYTKAPPATDSQGKPLDTSSIAESPEYHWAPSPLPLSSGPMGFPASEEYVETVYHCEMAEFQMWGDVTVDPAQETIRRAFIEFEKPEESQQPGSHRMKPADPKKAEKLLGRPHIQFHGSSKWKKGKNSGSIGIEVAAGAEQENPAGQFKPTGRIEQYKPDPTIEK